MVGLVLSALVKATFLFATNRTFSRGGGEGIGSSEHDPARQGSAGGFKESSKSWSDRLQRRRSWETRCAAFPGAHPAVLTSPMLQFGRGQDRMPRQDEDAYSTWGP